MNQTLKIQIKALESSITHWRENASAPSQWDVSIAAEDCACCNKWIQPDKKDHCTGCPIQAYTGVLLCGKTPYDKVHSALQDWQVSENYWQVSENSSATKNLEEQFRVAAQEEISFLQEVLDDLKKQEKESCS